MAKITASITEVDIDGDYREDVPGVEATCTRCAHTTESYGQESVSIRRCLVLLREECPRNEKNYYVAV